jgi:uncharacterized protein (DUF2147 family)
MEATLRFLLPLILILSHSAALADPIVGLWKTDAAETGTAGLVQIAPCGAGFCGVIKGAADGGSDPAQAHLLGRKVLWDMQPTGDGIYEGGRLWSPARDKEYKGRLTLTGNKLVLEGCVMALCQVGGRWTRVK